VPSLHDAVLVPGFGGTAKQPLLVRLQKAIAENGLSAAAVTLSKRRPQPSLAGEVEELRAFWRELTGGRGALVGRSFGGRVAVRVAIKEAVPAVVLLGFPVRPPGKKRPEDERALAALTCPTLILQGEDDELGPPALLRELCAGQKNVHIEVIAGAGHSYKKSEGAVVARVAEWLAATFKTT
jgi:predicted alpha/beta-hydrolase family hydrolase